MSVGKHFSGSHGKSTRSKRCLEFEVGIHCAPIADLEERVVMAIEQRFKKGRASVRLVGESVRRGKVFSVSFSTKTELDKEEMLQLLDLLKVVVFQAITKMVPGGTKIKTYTH